MAQKKKRIHTLDNYQHQIVVTMHRRNNNVAITSTELWCLSMCASLLLILFLVVAKDQLKIYHKAIAVHKSSYGRRQTIYT